MNLDVLIVILLPLAVLVLSEKSNNTNGFHFQFQKNEFKVVFERAEVVRFNRRYMSDFSVVTFKYNRTTTAVNSTFSFESQDLNPNMQVVVQAYKFLSNEYRQFPIHFQVNFCEAINKNYLGLRNFYVCGNYSSCLAPKGKIFYVCNWGLDDSKFPPHIPTGRYMLEFQAVLRSEEIWLLRGYGSVSRPIVYNKK